MHALGMKKQKARQPLECSPLQHEHASKKLLIVAAEKNDFFGIRDTSFLSLT